MKKKILIYLECIMLFFLLTMPLLTKAEEKQDRIQWKIYFVDALDHSTEVWPFQTGEIQDGGILVLHFPSTIYKNNQVWECEERAPLERVVYGPGNYIEYVEFHGKTLSDQPNHDQEVYDSLNNYVELARVQEVEITNEVPEQIPESRFFVSGQLENDCRVRSVATQIDDAASHFFYVIGKNFIPNGIAIAEWFESEIEYSNLLEQEISVGEDIYYVARMGIQKKISTKLCKHLWITCGTSVEKCLEKGRETYQCQLCGEKRKVYLAPKGHLDQDQDGVCDRCGDLVGGSSPKVHWNLGDEQVRILDGKQYLFRCIDQNYSDADANHQQSALFLCESVIPADYGSDYQIKQQEDGSHKYEFVPGPIVNFGNSNDYKYSAVYKWLGQSKTHFDDAETVSIGNSYAYMGNTGILEYSSFDENRLNSYYIGNQQMKEKLFILSVDEAVKYRQELWKFDGSEEENPQSQYTPFSKGYWLRSPMGTNRNSDTGYAYVVDLVNGNIHPAAIKPTDGTENEGFNVTTTYGIRPAFVMKQD